MAFIVKPLDDKAETISPAAARQGGTSRRMLWVLAISIILACAAMGAFVFH